jgi:hypothetical protein
VAKGRTTPPSTVSVGTFKNGCHGEVVMRKPTTVYIAGRIERSRDRYGVVYCALDDYDWEKPKEETPPD